MKYILLWIAYEVIRSKSIWLFNFLINYNDRKNKL
jgi:hypothetical protein